MPRATPRKQEWKDEYTLLCERCGYIIEDLAHSLPCPECGKPITESLPERRIGTPWQQKPGIMSLQQTWWMTLRHPKRALDTQQIAKPRWFTSVTIALASITTSLGWLLPVYLPRKTMDEFENPSIMNMIPVILLMMIPPFILFWILTFIETHGIRFFGNQRQYRITREISKTIIAHGSVGWLLSAFGLMLTQVVGFALIYIMTPDLPPERGDWLDGYFRAFNGPPSWVHTVNWLLYVLVLPGFLFFETFAYLGLRRCKYANTIPPEPPPVYTFSNEPTP